jgi:hypothetical protein
MHNRCAIPENYISTIFQDTNTISKPFPFAKQQIDLSWCIMSKWIFWCVCHGCMLTIHSSLKVVQFIKKIPWRFTVVYFTHIHIDILPYTHIHCYINRVHVCLTSILLLAPWYTLGNKHVSNNMQNKWLGPFCSQFLLNVDLHTLKCWLYNET